MPTFYKDLLISWVEAMGKPDRWNSKGVFSKVKPGLGMFSWWLWELLGVLFLQRKAVTGGARCEGHAAVNDDTSEQVWRKWRRATFLSLTHPQRTGLQLWERRRKHLKQFQGTESQVPVPVGSWKPKTAVTLYLSWQNGSILLLPSHGCNVFQGVTALCRQIDRQDFQD